MKLDNGELYDILIALELLIENRLEYAKEVGEEVLDKEAMQDFYDLKDKIETEYKKSIRF